MINVAIAFFKVTLIYFLHMTMCACALCMCVFPCYVMLLRLEDNHRCQSSLFTVCDLGIKLTASGLKAILPWSWWYLWVATQIQRDQMTHCFCMPAFVSWWSEHLLCCEHPSLTSKHSLFSLPMWTEEFSKNLLGLVFHTGTASWSSTSWNKQLDLSSVQTVSVGLPR